MMKITVANILSKIDKYALQKSLKDHVINHQHKNVNTKKSPIPHNLCIIDDTELICGLYIEIWGEVGRI